MPHHFDDAVGELEGGFDGIGETAAVFATHHEPVHDDRDVVVLPAIQRLRETSARTTCQNRLKEIAFGCHKYATAKGHLPPGLIGPRLDPATRIPYWPGSGTKEDDSRSAPFVGVLAIIGVLTSVISVFFYLRLVVMMYMTPAAGPMSLPTVPRMAGAAR